MVCLNAHTPRVSLNELAPLQVSDSKVVVRKAASMALVAYMHSTRDAHSVMLALLRVGIDSADWRQRQARRAYWPPPPLTSPLARDTSTEGPPRHPASHCPRPAEYRRA